MTSHWLVSLKTSFEVSLDFLIVRNRDCNRKHLTGSSSLSIRCTSSVLTQLSSSEVDLKCPSHPLFADEPFRADQCSFQALVMLLPCWRKNE